MRRTIRNHPYTFLLIVSAYLYLIGNGLLAVTDTAESNYALTAKEMVLSGDWLSPQIYGHYWYDKPIFYYWELAASFAVFGFNEFAARFPSAVLGCANILFTFWFARRIYDEKAAWASAIILGTSFEFWLLSKAVITDATLFLFMSASVAFFYLGYKENRNYYFLCYLFAGLAVLTKGPIGLALPGFSSLLFLIWKKDLKEMTHVHLFSGLLLFLLVGGSWYFYMYLVHGRDFIINFFGVHNFLRATVAEHARQDVWYFYIGMFLAGFLPWSFAMPVSVYKRFRHRDFHIPPMSDATRFLITWAFAVILIFQIIATKYTTYTFPSLFAFAILGGQLWARKLHTVAKTGVILCAVYSALTLLVAPLAMIDHSGREVGTSLAELQSDAPVLFYGDYRTSTVFYSGDMIARLAKEKDIENMEPNGISWNAKNVMPFVAEESIDPAKDYIVVVSADKQKDFLKNTPGKWAKVENAGKYEIWERK